MKLQGKTAPITGGNSIELATPPRESSVPSDYSYSK